MRKEVTEAINALFPYYLAEPYKLPMAWRADVNDANSDAAVARLVTDYVSGMTDRFAIQQYELIARS